MKYVHRQLVISLLAMAVLLLAACAPVAAPAQPSEAEPAAEVGAEEDAWKPLKKVPETVLKKVLEKEVADGPQTVFLPKFLGILVFDQANQGAQIEEDPTRDAGLRVLMGPFTVYMAENVEEAAWFSPFRYALCLKRRSTEFR